MRDDARSMLTLVVGLTAWSLAPVWVVDARGLAAAPVVAMLAILIATVVALIFSAVSPGYSVAAALRSTRERGLVGSATGVGALAFFAYPLLYFSALQTGPPLLVNLVNYLWPIIGLVMVAVVRRGTGSLELLMAAGFGFVGAALAILNGTQGDGLWEPSTSPLPFALAALGAIAYGTMSAFMNAMAPRQEGRPGVHFFLIALCVGGLGCAVALAGTAIVDADLLSLDLSGGRGSALLVYSVLHPISHFCWLTAIQNPRIPGFTSAFIVPVCATIALAVAAHGALGPEILAALVMVLCGVLFSSIHDRGVPVAFAVALAGTGSLQVSVSVPMLPGVGNADGMDSLSEVMVALVAIFGGFVLTNSIARYASLQAACAAFYQRARDLAARSGGDFERVSADLDGVDASMLSSAYLRRSVAQPAPRTHPGLAAQWARFDLAAGNRVSPYEWLVLTIGASGVIIALHLAGFGQATFVASLVRALATAVVIGLLFAVRDYDMNRPDRVSETLLTLRHRFELPVPPTSPLAVYLTRVRPSGVDWTAVALVMLVFASIVSVILNLD